MAFRRSPKPGALMTSVLNDPRSLLTTNVASASPSTSSAMITNVFETLTNFSRKGRISETALIFLSVMSTYASSISASILSGLVTKYADAYPLSNSIPSLYSISIVKPFPSSTDTTPSRPTLSRASAILAPISASPAETVATWVISSLFLIGLAILLSSSTTAAAAFSMPFLTTMGLAPAVTFFIQDEVITWAKRVAVVVPSPAESLVLLAASLTSWAPMFSNGSARSISLATETPS